MKTKRMLASPEQEKEAREMLASMLREVADDIESGRRLMESYQINEVNGLPNATEIKLRVVKALRRSVSTA